MSFTATIQSINYQNDQFNTQVLFNDSATGWTATKNYSLPTGTTQSQAVTQITTDGNAYKAALAQNTALQSKVGTVITI
ncbi:hypothetical protein AHiyo6_01230 [Arthrobacter sp. Hiyo6]|nr:hypothetical protein AHiyo6_01230 [Arthrobacter sp. Hiyo6]